MKKYGLYFAFFLLGALLVFLVFNTKKDKPAEATDGRLISYQIKKLNKMVVVEEEYQYQQKFEDNLLPKSWLDDYSILKYIDHKQVVLLASGTGQMSYDMSKMKMEVDEDNKKIILSSLPSPEYKLFVETKFLNLDTGMINEVDADELNKYKDYMRKQIEKQVNKEDLEIKAHQQLVENLSDLFVLAKALGWEIDDQTEISKDIKNSIDIL